MSQRTRLGALQSISAISAAARGTDVDDAVDALRVIGSQDRRPQRTAG
jgi:hypothetical protein